MKGNRYIELLKNRSFMAFWGSTTLLRLASNVLQFALAMYVLDLTGSALAYSSVLSMIIIPRILCTSAAGYFADFRDSIQILRRGTLVLVGLMAGFLAIHTLVMPLSLILIDMLVVCLELCETFLAPSEGRVLNSIVSQDEIAPASKISSLDDGIVELLSSVIGSIFYGFEGLTGVLSIALVMEILSFFMAADIRHGTVGRPESKSSFCALKKAKDAEGKVFDCLKETPYVIGLVLFAPLFNFFINPLFSVAVPHYLRIVLGADVRMYAGFNMALGIAGLAAPFAAVLLIDDKAEYRANQRGTAACAAVLLGLAGILYFKKGTVSLNQALYLVTGGMMLIAAVITIMNIASAISVKKNISEAIMGRMMALIQLCAVVSVPLGQLFYGLCADHLPITSLFLISVCGLGITFAVMHRTYRMIHGRER